MSVQSPPENLLNGYLTLQQASEQSNRSIRWWQHRIQRREVPFVQFGGRRLIPIASVRADLEARTVKPVGSR